MVDSIKDEKARLIVGCQFDAFPLLDDQYFEYIKGIPLYLGIYKRWVLSNGCLMPHLPTDPEMYRLREDVLGIHRIENPKTIVINEALFMFLLDICRPFLEPIVNHAMIYYPLSEKTDHEVMVAIQKAFQGALLLCDDEQVEKHGYPDFIVALDDAFKIFFAQEIEFKHKIFPTDDEEFVEEIEKEWTKLLPHSDSLYGFEVMPVIAPEDMLRYLRLPFANKSWQKISKSKTHHQMLNYIVSLSTFKPLPDNRIKTYFGQELCSLFLPLAESIVKSLKKKKEIELSAEELKGLVVNEISKALKNFDYFYTTKKSLGNKKISPFSVALFPITDSNVAKLGHIYSYDEFPFTSFIQKRLKNKIMLYFKGDPASENDSLDQEINDDGDTLIDIVNTNDPSYDTRGFQIPDYNAQTREKEIIGWKRDTFADIVGVHPDTLIRWEKAGLLIPKRYSIYSYKTRDNTLYRAYTDDDLKKVKGIQEFRAKNQRHKI